MSLKGNALVAQSGGPTAVINNTVSGVVQEWLRQDPGGKIIGGINGVKGILEENFIDLGKQDPAIIEGFRYTPGAGLYSCRYKVEDNDREKLVEICRKYNIRYFFYNGGNDSMDTAHKMQLAAEAANYDMRIIGVPKTVDNDLVETDHTPGYGSAAKYIATTTRETGIDLQSVSTTNKVVILEAMGRNAGWLTASAALAKRSPEDAPHLIYLPEVVFDLNSFIKDVKRIYDEIGTVSIVASEGLMNKDGEYISASKVKDDFGHKQLSGVGEFLKNQVEAELGLKTRCNTMGSAQRSATHFASKTDADEAYEVGVDAVRAALNDESGIMISFQREPGEIYKINYSHVPLAKVANAEKKMPLEWINKDKNYVTDDFINYARPLIEGEIDIPMINGLPNYVKIDLNKGKIKL